MHEKNDNINHFSNFVLSACGQNEEKPKEKSKDNAQQQESGSIKEIVTDKMYKVITTEQFFYL